MAPRKRIVRTIKSANCEQVVAKRVTGIPCDFCGEREDDELKYGNLYKVGHITAHYFCVLLSSGAVQDGDDDEGLLGFLYKDILKELNRSQKNQCASRECRRKGATLGCAKKTCKKQYHLPCARKNEAICLFYDKFEVFCKHHAVKQEIPDRVIQAREERRRRNQDTVTECQICFSPVGPSPSYDTFWPPCCGPEKDEWFHRDCLAELALHAGLYHLKCPLCNNKDVFNRAVESSGYYIPDRDASWEREGNAFEDPAPMCNADECPNTLRDEDTGAWRLVVCVACGGQEVHEGCAVTLPHRCDTCRDTTQDMGLVPLPTIREIERGVEVPQRVMTTRMSLRRTMSKETLQNAKLYLSRNKRTSTNFKTDRDELNVTPKVESVNHVEQPTPTKLIREGLVSKGYLYKDPDVDKITETILKKLNKPAPYSKKREHVLQIIEYIFDEFQGRPEESASDLKPEPGPSRVSSSTYTEPIIDHVDIKKEFTTPVKKNERGHYFMSPSRGHPRNRASPLQKQLNLERTLQRIESLVNHRKTQVAVVSNLVERIGDIDTAALVSEGSNLVERIGDVDTAALVYEDSHLVERIGGIDCYDEKEIINDVSNTDTPTVIENSNVNDSSDGDKIYRSNDDTMDLSLVHSDTTQAIVHSPENIDRSDKEVNDTSNVGDKDIASTKTSADANVSVGQKELNSPNNTSQIKIKKNMTMRYYNSNGQSDDDTQTLRQKVKEARDSIFKSKDKDDSIAETSLTKATTETKSAQDTVEYGPNTIPEDSGNDSTSKTRRKRQNTQDLHEEDHDIENFTETEKPTVTNKTKRRILHVQDGQNGRNTQEPKLTPRKINVCNKTPDIVNGILQDVDEETNITNEIIDLTDEESSPLKYGNNSPVSGDIIRYINEMKLDKGTDKHEQCWFNHKHETDGGNEKRISTPIDFATTAVIEKEMEAKYNSALEKVLRAKVEKDKSKDKSKKNKRKRAKGTVQLSITNKKGVKKSNKMRIRLHLNFNIESQRKRHSEPSKNNKNNVFEDFDTELNETRKPDNKMKQTLINNFYTVTPR